MRLLVLIERLSIGFAHRIIIFSPLQAAILKQRSLSKPYIIVPNVPDETLFPKVEILKNDDVVSPAVLITHGTMSKTYGPGIQVLIKALRYILEEIPVKLYILGDGEFLENLKNEAIEKGLQQHVIFTGRVPLEEVQRYISYATIGVVSFLKGEYAELLHPNKLFEYVALGKPVVASDTLGIRVYFDERHIEFFQPGNPEDLASKVIALLKDPQRRTQLARQALNVYETIRWERTKVVYKSFIRDLVEVKN